MQQKKKVVFIHPVSENKIVNAGTTLGIDEMFLAMNMAQHPEKYNLIKAAVGMKDIKFRQPLIEWEQQYNKIHNPYINGGGVTCLKKKK